MDYALLFSAMGVTILFLLYKNFRLAKHIYIQDRFLQAIIEGEVEVKKTATGAELIIKKEA